MIRPSRAGLHVCMGLFNMQNRFEVFMCAHPGLSCMELSTGGGWVGAGRDVYQTENSETLHAGSAEHNGSRVYMMMNENENKTLFIVILFAARLHKLRGGVCKSLPSSIKHI